MKVQELNKKECKAIQGGYTLPPNFVKEGLNLKFRGAGKTPRDDGPGDKGFGGVTKLHRTVWHM